MKYSKISKLANHCLLILPHGNADPERGFSINKNILKVHGTTLKEDTIIALRFIKDELIKRNGTMNISISKDLIKSCKSARSSYQAFLEAQRLEKELEEKRQLEVSANKKVDRGEK